MTTEFPVPAGSGSCPSGKVEYLNRKQAKIAKARIGDKGLRVYRCECGWCHLGHVPRSVRNGRVDKTTWLASKEDDR